MCVFACVCVCVCVYVCVCVWRLILIVTDSSIGACAMMS